MASVIFETKLCAVIAYNNPYLWRWSKNDGQTPEGWKIMPDSFSCAKDSHYVAIEMHDTFEENAVSTGRTS